MGVSIWVTRMDTIDLLPETISNPSSGKVNNLTLAEKIKVLSEFVVLIKIL